MLAIFSINQLILSNDFLEGNKHGTIKDTKNINVKLTNILNNIIVI